MKGCYKIGNIPELVSGPSTLVVASNGLRGRCQDPVQQPYGAGRVEMSRLGNNFYRYVLI